MSDAEVIDPFRAALVARGIIPPPESSPMGVSTAAMPRASTARVTRLTCSTWTPSPPADSRTGAMARAGRRGVPTPAASAPAMEVLALSEKVAASRRERETQVTRQRAEARMRAALIWRAAQPAPDSHPYLLSRQVRSHGLRLHRGGLVVPLRDTSGALQNLQFISEDGAKRFLKGGRVRGCYFGMGVPAGALFIVEGYATGATVHEATGHAVAVAFDAGNLPHVAIGLRAKFPDLKIVLCADNDTCSPGNPGLTKAIEDTALDERDGLRRGVVTLRIGGGQSPLP